MCVGSKTSAAKLTATTTNKVTEGGTDNSTTPTDPGSTSAAEGKKTSGSSAVRKAAAKPPAAAPAKGDVAARMNVELNATPLDEGPQVGDKDGVMGACSAVITLGWFEIDVGSSSAT